MIKKISEPPQRTDLWLSGSAADTLDDTSVISFLITFYVILQIQKQLTQRIRLPPVTGTILCLDSSGLLPLLALLP